MARLSLGDRLMVVPGCGLEWTDVGLHGVRAGVRRRGATSSAPTPTNGRRQLRHLAPGREPALPARHPLEPARCGVTRSLARPNYFDLVPYQLVLHEDLEIKRGNPACGRRPRGTSTCSTSASSPSVGVVSAGVFHKRLNDYIYFFTEEQDDRRGRLRGPRAENGDAATLTGFEVALQNRLSFLPAPFDGLGFYGNYTFTDSEASFPDREGEERVAARPVEARRQPGAPLREGRLLRPGGSQLPRQVHLRSGGDGGGRHLLRQPRAARPRREPAHRDGDFASSPR